MSIYQGDILNIYNISSSNTYMSNISDGILSKSQLDSGLSISIDTTTATPNRYTIYDSTYIKITELPYNITQIDTSPENFTFYINAGNGNDFTFSNISIDRDGDLESYNDPPITVYIGDSLVFINETLENHPLAISNSNNELLISQTDGILNWTPSEIGTYNYYCTVPGHSTNMCNVINVQSIPTENVSVPTNEYNLYIVDVVDENHMYSNIVYDRNGKVYPHNFNISVYTEDTLQFVETDENNLTLVDQENNVISNLNSFYFTPMEVELSPFRLMSNTDILATINVETLPKEEIRTYQSTSNYRYEIGTDNLHLTTVGIDNTTIANIPIKIKTDDVIIFSNIDSLIIKNDEDILIAESASGSNTLRWSPDQSGIYWYYSDTYPDNSNMITVSDMSYNFNTSNYKYEIVSSTETSYEFVDKVGYNVDRRGMLPMKIRNDIQVYLNDTVVFHNKTDSNPIAIFDHVKNKIYPQLQDRKISWSADNIGRYKYYSTTDLDNVGFINVLYPPVLALDRRDGKDSIILENNQLILNFDYRDLEYEITTYAYDDDYKKYSNSYPIKFQVKEPSPPIPELKFTPQPLTLTNKRREIDLEFLFSSPLNTPLEFSCEQQSSERYYIDDSNKLIITPNLRSISYDINIIAKDTIYQSINSNLTIQVIEEHPISILKQIDNLVELDNIDPIEINLNRYLISYIGNQLFYSFSLSKTVRPSLVNQKPVVELINNYLYVYPDFRDDEYEITITGRDVDGGYSNLPKSLSFTVSEERQEYVNPITDKIVISTTDENNIMYDLDVYFPTEYYPNRSYKIYGERYRTNTNNTVNLVYYQNKLYYAKATGSRSNNLFTTGFLTVTYSVKHDIGVSFVISNLPSNQVNIINNSTVTFSITNLKILLWGAIL